MKLSIEAELVYNFANETQVIANLEASRTSDQLILSESLDIQPPAQILSDTTPCGDRRIRAALSGNVTIRYAAVVENNLRQLLPPQRRLCRGREQCRDHCRADVCGPDGSLP
jgi:hypothetical protein